MRQTNKECLGSIFCFHKLVIVLLARYMAYIMDTNEEERAKVLPGVISVSLFAVNVSEMTEFTCL